MRVYRTLEDENIYWDNVYNESHREDGPAIIHSDGSKWWYLFDIKFDQKSWLNKILKVKVSNRKFQETFKVGPPSYAMDFDDSFEFLLNNALIASSPSNQIKITVEVVKSKR